MKKKGKRMLLEEALAHELKDPEFRFYFEREQAITHIAHIIKNARQRVGLTQTQLAEKAKTSQTVIARLESGSDSRIPSLELLERIAGALKARLIISFEHKAAA